MNRLSSVIISLIVIANISIHDAKGDWTSEAFPVQSHDFGAVAILSKAEFRFPIHNPLDKTIHIREVRTSCGCTTPTLTSNYIEPGKSEALIATLNTSNFIGEKFSTLIVVIDAPFDTEIEVIIKGFIRSDVMFKPGEIDFGHVRRGKSIVKSTKLYYLGKNDWEVLDVRSNQPWIQVGKTEVKRSGENVEYELEVKLTDDAPVGFFREDVLVATNDHDSPIVPLHIFGEVEGPLTIAPHSVSLGNVSIGEPVTKRFVIRGESPFVIGKISCTGWSLDYNPDTEPKEVHIIDITFTPLRNVGQEKSEIILDTVGESSMRAKSTLIANIRSAEVTDQKVSVDSEVAVK